MSLPVVAIVGRPNVGKSSLFNVLARRRISIVDPTAGVTRDRLSTVCEHDGAWFELIDTGGYGVEDRDNLTAQIEHQISVAVDSADIILFLVDALEECMPLDEHVARYLKGKQDRTILVANKTDEQIHEAGIGSFLKLGFGQPFAISTLHGIGVRELMTEVVRRFDHREGAPPEPVMKVALIGRRNVGKSSFVNALAGEPRVIVSEIAGTTRDSIDVRIVKDDQTILVIDTAGVRKVRKMADDVEFYAYTRAQRTVRRADVVLILIDATEKISEVDKRIATYAKEQFKPIILVVNKWDLAKDRATTEAYGEYLSKTLPHMDFAPIAFTTAIDGKNINSVMELATSLFKQARSRVDTGRLNAALQKTMDQLSPPGGAGSRQPKIYYATQIGVAPPTIVLFSNHIAMLREDYRRYMERHLGATLPFTEVPLRLLWRQRVTRLSALGDDAPVPRQRSQNRNNNEPRRTTGKRNANMKHKRRR